MYQYFTEKDSVYTSKPIKYYRILLIIIMLGSGGFVFFDAPGFGVKLSGLIFIALSFLWIAAFTQQIQFNPSQKEFNLSYFGLFKQNFTFSQFQNFHLVKHYTNGIYTGTSVKMVLNIGGILKKKDIYSQIYNTKKVQIFIEEMKQIMGEQLITRV